MQLVSYVSQSWERDPSSVARPEVSSTPPVKGLFFCFFFSQHGKFFLLHRIKGLGAENVVQCADCAEATWLWFGDSTHWTTFHSWFENVHGLKFWLEMGFSHLPPSCLTKLLVKRHHRVRLICIVSFNVFFFFFHNWLIKISVLY